eukprot:1161454-Pelagomonas_calceolata.AAC.10
MLRSRSALPCGSSVSHRLHKACSKRVVVCAATHEKPGNPALALLTYVRRAALPILSTAVSGPLNNQDNILYRRRWKLSSRRDSVLNRHGNVDHSNNDLGLFVQDSKSPTSSNR